MAASASGLARNIFIAPRTHDSSCMAQPGALLHPDTARGVRMLRRTDSPVIDSSACPRRITVALRNRPGDPNGKTYRPPSLDGLGYSGGKRAEREPDQLTTRT